MKKRSRVGITVCGIAAIAVLGVGAVVVFGDRGNSAGTGTIATSYKGELKPSESDLKTYLGDGGNALAYKEVMNASESALKYVNQFYLSDINSSRLASLLSDDFQVVQNVYSGYGLQKQPSDLQTVDNYLRDNAKNQIMLIGFMRNAAQNDDTNTLGENVNSLQSYVAAEKNVQSELGALQQKYIAVETKKAASEQPSGPAQVSVGGGLGDTLATIKKMYGTPTSVPVPMNNGVGSFNFGSDITVSFEDGRAYLFQRDFTGEAAHFAMQVISGTAFPKGATPPSTVQNTQMGQEFVYQSDQLAKVFPANLFVGKTGSVAPGTFTLVESQVNGNVTMSLSIGNNP